MSITARTRAGDPGTSYMAAAKVDVPKQRARVLAILTDIGPATDEELVREHARREIVENWPRASASGLRSRRAELFEDGVVEAVEDPDARTTLGNHALRWRVVADDAR